MVATCTASWRQDTSAEFNELATSKAGTQGVFLIPRDSITDLDSKDTAQRGNLNERDGCI
jgi:hypothetical protein